MKANALNNLAEQMRLACTFVVGDSGVLDGVFLGFWSSEFANVEISGKTLESLRSLAIVEGTDDFEMVEEISPGRFALAGNYAVTLVTVEASPMETAQLLHALAAK